MRNNNNRYNQMQQIISAVLGGSLLFFIIFLIASGNGIIWLKVITAIITILSSGLSLGYLYLTQELLRRRSLWLSTAFAAILVCTLASLILYFPSPRP